MRLPVQCCDITPIYGHDLQIKMKHNNKWGKYDGCFDLIMKNRAYSGENKVENFSVVRPFAYGYGCQL